MADPDPTTRTSNRRGRRHVEFSDLPPASPVGAASSSLIDSDEDDFDAEGGGGGGGGGGSLASLLDLADGNASVMTAHTEVSVSARSFASVDTEMTEKAGNRTTAGTAASSSSSGGRRNRSNVPGRVGVGIGGAAAASPARARRDAELARRIAGYEEQYHQQRAEKGKKRGRNRGGSSNGGGGGGGGGPPPPQPQQVLPNSGFQARAALAAAQGRAAAAALPGSAPGSADGAPPEAKVVAEVMAELEAELDAEEDEERAAFGGGGGGGGRGGRGGGGGRRSRGNGGTTTPTELRRYKSAGPEAGGGGAAAAAAVAGGAELSKRSTASSGSGVSTAAVAGSNPKLARSRRRSSHQRDASKEGTASAAAAAGAAGPAAAGPGSGDGGNGGNPPAAAAAADIPAVADKDVEAAAALFQMGQMEMANGNFEAAARCLEQALVMNQTALGMDHPIVGDIQHSLGLVQIEYGKYETACLTLWEAQRIRKLNADLVGAADSLQEIGKVHRQGGRTELALDCYGECLRVRRAELGDDNLKVADAYCDLGHTEGDLGRNTDALQHFKNALTILKLNSMNDSGLDGRGQLKHGDQICHLLQKMSKMELDFGDVDHALAHLQEFVETRRLIGRTSDVAYVEALVNVGRISKDHNGDEETAYDVLVEALEVFDASRLGEINYGSHARIGQEARDLLRELGGSAGTSQKSIFKRFGVGFDSLSDEIG